MTLVGNIEESLEFFFKFCGLLTISELYYMANIWDRLHPRYRNRVLTDICMPSKFSHICKNILHTFVSVLSTYLYLQTKIQYQQSICLWFMLRLHSQNLLKVSFTMIKNTVIFFWNPSMCNGILVPIDLLHKREDFGPKIQIQWPSLRICRGISKKKWGTYDYAKWNLKPNISSIFYFVHVNNVWISGILCFNEADRCLYFE